MTAHGWETDDELAERIRLVEAAHRSEHDLTRGDHTLVLVVCGVVPVVMMLAGILL
jgi:hypothetical protein